MKRKILKQVFENFQTKPNGGIYFPKEYADTISKLIMGGYLEKNAFQLNFDGRYHQNHNEPMTPKGVEYFESNWWRRFKQYQVVEIFIDIGALAGFVLVILRILDHLKKTAPTLPH